MAEINNIPKMSIIMVLLLGIAFLYVWQRIQVFRLGYKMRNTEKCLNLLNEENTLLQLGISRIVSPQNIKAKTEKLGLKLNPPEKKQVIRIK